VRPLLFCEPKVYYFFKGRPHRQSTWQKRRSTRCLAGALEGKWRRGTRSLTRGCGIVPSSFLCHSPRSDKQPVRAQLYAEFSPGGLHFVNWRRKWDGGEVAAHGQRRGRRIRVRPPPTQTFVASSAQCNLKGTCKCESKSIAFKAFERMVLPRTSTEPCSSMATPLGAKGIPANKGASDE